MKRKQILVFVVVMFMGVGVLIVGVVYVDNFVDCGNFDNVLNGQCIDGINLLCVVMKNGSYVVVSIVNVMQGINVKVGISGIVIGDQLNVSSKGGSGSGGVIVIGVGLQVLVNLVIVIGMVVVVQGNILLVIGCQLVVVGDFLMVFGNVVDVYGMSLIVFGYLVFVSGDCLVVIGGVNLMLSDGVLVGVLYDVVM